MYAPYVRLNNPQTQLDLTAKNALGTIYAPPWGAYTPTGSGPVFSTTVSLSTSGYGAPPIFKYVYFYDASALTGTLQAAPAPVYWMDNSFTTITGNAADAYSAATIVSPAGYLMPNTTALGTSQTAAQWYAQLSQSYVWIQIGGFLSQAVAPSTQTTAAIGNPIYGLTTGSWVSAVGSVANASTANASRYFGLQWSAIASSLCDVMVNGDSCFWGS
jgi:hypothetical protein